MKTFLIGAAVGLLVGGALTFYFFVGVPRAVQLPGAPVRPPDAAATASAAQIVLTQDFFNEVLAAIFRDMNDPAFLLASKGDDAALEPIRPEHAAYQAAPVCESKITILEQGSGIRTELRFEDKRIAAPLAFSGSYNSPFGCLQFSGWAKGSLELRFDEAAQTVFGIINVETVNLDGVNPILNGLVTPLVQSTLNNRVNPIRIIDGKQIGLDVPVASTGARLQAAVKDVRAEIVENVLNLYVKYEFRGTPVL